MRRINDLATAIAEKQQIGQREAEHFLLTMVDVINDALHYEKQLKVKGLGTFKVSAVSARESVSVKTGQRITIGQREKISFSPEASMRDLVNKPFAQFETVVVNDGVSFDEIDAKYKNTLTESPEDVDAEDVADVPSAASEPVEEPVEELANEAAEEFVAPVVPLAPVAPLVEVPVVELAEESIEEAQEEIQEEIQEEPQEGIQEEPQEGIQEEPQEEASVEAQEEPAENLVEDAGEEPAEELPEAPAEDVSEANTEEAAEEMVPAEDVSEANTEESAAEFEPAEEQTTETNNQAPNYLMENQAKVDDYGYPLKENEEVVELSAQLKKKSRLVKLLMGVIACLLVAAGAGYYYMNKLLQDRDNRIAHLVAQIQEDQHNTYLHATGVRPDDNRPGRPPRQAVAAKTAQENTEEQMAERERRVKEREIALKAEELKHQEALNAKRAELAKEEEARKAKLAKEQAAAAAKLAKQQAEQKAQQQAVKLAQQKAAAQKAEQAKAAAAKAAAQQAAAKTAAAAKAADKSIPNQAAYNKDPRVRLGAYVITGVSEVVTVRAGQTLAGISKAYLGPGMECYVEAVNGGIKEVKAGQKLKIPAVKVKKSVSKK